jgi:hypothetical protein
MLILEHVTTGNYFGGVDPNELFNYCKDYFASFASGCSKAAELVDQNTKIDPITPSQP